MEKSVGFLYINVQYEGGMPLQIVQSAYCGECGFVVYYS